MEIVNFFNTSQGSLLDSIKNYTKNPQEEQESKSSAVSYSSASSDRVSFSQEAMQLAAQSGSVGQDQGESGATGNGGASSNGGGSGGGSGSSSSSSSTDDTSNIQELQAKLQSLQSKLAAAMETDDDAQAGAVQGQIAAVMAQIAALQASNA